MKVLSFADAHCHRWPQFAVPDIEFETNRLRHVIACLDQIREYAIKHGIKLVIFSGDLVHVRGIIHVAVNKILRAAIKRFKTDGIDLKLIAGNHDQANKSGSITILDNFEEYADVIESFRIDVIDGIKIGYIPFREDKTILVEQFKQCREEKVQYVFAHIPVAGSVLSQGYKSKPSYNEVSVEEIEPESFYGVIMGHYHKSQFLAPNLFYLGSLCQTSFSDIGEEKGFWEMSLVPNKKLFLDSLKFIKTDYPEFKQIDIVDKRTLLRFLNGYKESNFYKVNLNIKFKLPTDDLTNVTVVSKSDEKPYQARIKNLDRMKPEEVVVEYTKHKGGTDSEINYGLSILSRLKTEKEKGNESEA